MSATIHLGYLLHDRSSSSPLNASCGWFYGLRDHGHGQGWESRHKVHPLPLGKARAALRRLQDQWKARGEDPSPLVIVAVSEVREEVEKAAGA